MATADRSELPDVSASIVLFRNPMDEVRAAVGSLLADGVAQVFLVDNAPDDSPFAELASTFDRVTYIRSPGNVGYGAGHNQAIRRCVGEYRYHVVCNPDIIFAPGVLPGLRAELERRPEVGLCMPRIVDARGVVQFLCKQLPRPFDLFGRRFLPRAWMAARMRRFEMRESSYETEMSPPSLSGCFMFFRASVLADLGGFDERFFMYLEDVDISRRASKLARNLYFPGVSVTHGHAAGSYHSPRLLLAHVVSAVRYFNKWGWWPLA